MEAKGNIIDSFGRSHTYLRLSLTDKCNLRCTYCMPEDMQFMPSDRLMNADEILKLGQTFLDLGVRKIRLTGGEPLLRKDFEQIARNLSLLNVELAITTNAFYLHEYIDLFKEIGLKKINISLDTLNKEKFRTIAKRNYFDQTMDNIFMANQSGFFDLKLNAVIMKGLNDNELTDFIDFGINNNLAWRFIEFMPFNGNQWDSEKTVLKDTILTEISTQFNYQAIDSSASNTAQLFKIDDTYEFGIISTVSAPFCKGCNRIRVTADGKLKNCLFSTAETDLIGPLRRNEDLTSIILNEFQNKKEALGGRTSLKNLKTPSEYEKNRSMISIGG